MTWSVYSYIYIYIHQIHIWHLTVPVHRSKQCPVRSRAILKGISQETRKCCRTQQRLLEQQFRALNYSEACPKCDFERPVTAEHARAVSSNGICPPLLSTTEYESVDSWLEGPTWAPWPPPEGVVGWGRVVGGPGARAGPLDSRFHITVFRFEISDSRFQISDFRFQISYFRSQISDFIFQISDFRFYISGF